MSTNHTGRKYGKWTVIGDAPDKIYRSKKGGLITTRCVTVECICGTTKENTLYSIISGKSTKCIRCRKEEVKKNRRNVKIGEKYGQWTVIKHIKERLYKRKNYNQYHIRVLCKCSCGNTMEHDVHTLFYLRSKRCAKCSGVRIGNIRKKYSLLPTYGKWTVLYEYKTDNHHLMCKCRCTCGKEQYNYCNDLKRKKTKGCQSCRFK